MQGEASWIGKNKKRLSLCDFLLQPRPPLLVQFTSLAHITQASTLDVAATAKSILRESGREGKKRFMPYTVSFFSAVFVHAASATLPHQSSYTDTHAGGSFLTKPSPSRPSTPPDPPRAARAGRTKRPPPSPSGP